MALLCRVQCAILKALFNIRVTTVHKTRDSEINFKTFKMRSLRSRKS